jgi:sigma-54 dependent transcriptional regulator, acetoin dehydrogenase operon transcriptional activator AcoR
VQPSKKPPKSPPDLPPSDDFIRRAWEDVIIHRREPSYPVRKVILVSWARCRNLGLDPFRKHAPVVISKKRLTELQSHYREVIEIAQPVLKMIEISVRGTGFIATLSEKDGHVIEVCGDQNALETDVENFYIPGCQRSTEHYGTNGIGLCLDVGNPIQITGAEHFNINHHAWTCCSAPIRFQGEMIGAVTLSGRASGIYRHTLALVTAAASIIESRLLERDLNEGIQRLNSMLTSIYNSISGGFIALDKNHRITHLNRAASNMLGLSAEPLIGKPVTDFVVSGEVLAKQHDSLDFSKATEVTFISTDGPQTFLCRIDPILSSNQKMLGMVISMAENRRMIDIAKRIDGNFSKYEFDDILGRNPQFLKQIELAKIAAKSNSRVLIVGESGTGKELFAQAIHSYSHRCNGPFVAISCTAIPRDLIESELFGYKGGAFTGARERGMIGKFELAHKGTLFIDEINGLPLDLQAKLLRVLQQKEIMRLGDTHTISVDVRIVAASNTDLMDEVEAGHFREDLYYRLNVMEILIPPLRDRKEDIRLLTNHILGRLSQEIAIVKPLVCEDVMESLLDYHWPGNVRELENVLERALLLCHGERICMEHLSPRSRRKPAEAKMGTKSMQQGIREIIQTALEETGGNVAMTARRLKIARSTLYRKMK